MKESYPRENQMKDQKRNEKVQLRLTLEHTESHALSSSLITEADFNNTDSQVQVSIFSNSFSDLRARWNSLMRALIASEHSLMATRGGDKD